MPPATRTNRPVLRNIGYDIYSPPLNGSQGYWPLYKLLAPAALLGTDSRHGLDLS